MGRSNSKQIMVLMIAIILSLGVSALILVNKEYQNKYKAYLGEANHGDEMVKAEVRKQLASELRNTHELITKHNFRQFHFQLANGDSFHL